MQGKVIPPQVTDLADMLCQIVALQDFTDEDRVGVTKNNDVTSRDSCQVLESLQFKRLSRRGPTCACNGRCKMTRVCLEILVWNQECCITQYFCMHNSQGTHRLSMHKLPTCIMSWWNGVE